MPDRWKMVQMVSFNEYNYMLGMFIDYWFNMIDYSFWGNVPLMTARLSYFGYDFVSYKQVPKSDFPKLKDGEFIAACFTFISDVNLVTILIAKKKDIG